MYSCRHLYSLRPAPRVTPAQRCRIVELDPLSSFGLDANNNDLGSVQERNARASYIY